MSEEATYKYWAFISYSHRDEKWGKWLHRALETYRVPKRLVGRDTPAGPAPRRLMPVFRDRDELASSSDLGQVISEALEQSRYLIVICSPAAAQSRWVNEEVRTFQRLGQSNRVRCLIVDGEPNAQREEEECFPPTVRASSGEQVAADAREHADGRDNARLKLIAGMLGVGFDVLIQREQQRRKRRMMVAAALAALLVGLLAAVVQLGMTARRNARFTTVVQQFEQGLEATAWTESHLVSMDALVEQIARRSTDDGAAARLRLGDAMVKHVRSLINRPRLEGDDVERIENAIALYAGRSADGASSLGEALEKRLNQWEPILQLRAPFADAADWFEDPVRAEDQRLRFAVNDGKTLPLKLDCPADARLSVRFDEHWWDVPQIGLVLNDTEKDRYRFVLRPASETSATTSIISLRDAHRQGEQVELAIQRFETDLRVLHVPSDDLADGMLTMTATRQGARMSVQINDLPVLEFVEAFPPQHDQLGRYGLLPASEVGIIALTASRKLIAREPSPLEQADRLYTTGSFAEALEAYRQVAAQTQDTALGDESRVKIGMCLEGLGRLDDAAAQFEQVVASDTQWSALAGCRLWVLLLKQEKDEQARGVFQMILARMSPEKLAFMTPVELRHEILHKSRGISGDLLQVFETTLRMQRALGSPIIEQLRTTTRGVHELIAQRRFLEAERIIQQAFDSTLGFRLSRSNDIPQQYVWLLRLQGRQTDAAKWIEHHLQTTFKQYRHQRTLLYLDQCRTHWDLNRLPEADASLDAFFKVLPEADYDVSYLQGCLMRGFIRERMGDEQGAVAAWRAGTFDHWSSNTQPDVVPSQHRGNSDEDHLLHLMAGSLSASISDRQAHDLLAAYCRANWSSQSHNPSSRVLMASLESGMLAPYISADLFRSSKGHRLVRERVFIELAGFTSWRRRLYVLVAFHITAHGAFGRNFTDTEEAIFGTLQDVMDSEGQQMQKNKRLFPVALMAWQGMTGALGWETLSKELKPRWRGPLAYIMGHRYQRLNKPNDAAMLLRTAIADAEEGSDLQRLATDALAKLKAAQKPKGSVDDR